MLAALVLSLALGLILGGGVWLLAGSRLALAADPGENDLLNLGCYVAVAGAAVFVGVLLWAP